MAKITDYPSITAIDANTILLADGSSGTGKILASDMAKYALETYAGSTLAGSARSVKSAFDAVNSNMLNSVVLSPVTVSNLDTLSTSMPSVSIYRRRVSITSDANLGNYGGDLTGYKHNDNYEWQEFHSTSVHKIRYKLNGTWGAWNAVPTSAEVDSLNSKTQLTTTRTENNLVDATSFNRLAAYKRGNMLWLNGNLVVAEGKASSSVEIGRIAGWSAVSSVYQDVPFQGNGAKVIIVEITSGGVINISSVTGITSGFYRFSICVPCA